MDSGNLDLEAPVVERPVGKDRHGEDRGWKGGSLAQPKRLAVEFIVHRKDSNGLAFGSVPCRDGHALHSIGRLRDYHLAERILGNAKKATWYHDASHLLHAPEDPLHECCRKLVSHHRAVKPSDRVCQ
eukprot:3073862-Prymnesium_polylepis.1